MNPVITQKAITVARDVLKWSKLLILPQQQQKDQQQWIFLLNKSAPHLQWQSKCPCKHYSLRPLPPQQGRLRHGYCNLVVCFINSDFGCDLVVAVVLTASIPQNKTEKISSGGSRGISVKILHHQNFMLCGINHTCSAWLSRDATKTK